MKCVMMNNFIHLWALYPISLRRYQPFMLKVNNKILCGWVEECGR